MVINFYINYYVYLKSIFKMQQEFAAIMSVPWREGF